jgi:hypothetical protein
MWYEEKVSNFEIAVAKLKKNIAKHQICHTLPERSVCYAPHKFVAPKDFKYDQNMIPFTVISHLL